MTSMEELRQLAGLAAPIMMANALTNLLNLEDQIFLGHLGTEELVGAAIGNTYFGMLWFFLFGCATACDTLVSQSFGAGDAKQVAFWTNQGYLALGILNIPAAFLLWVSGWVIENVLGQTPEIAALAGLYCRIQIPGLLFLSAFTVLQKAQQSQNNMAPSVYCAVLSNVFNVVGNYLFIWVLGLGYPGSPLATSVSRAVSFLLLAILTWYHPAPMPHISSSTGGSVDKASVGAFSPLLAPEIVVQADAKEGLWKGLRQFFALGLPGGCMMVFESWSFFVITMESGLLGVIPCAASQVLMSFCTLVFFTFGAAIGQAGTIRVGNLVGAQLAMDAKRAAQTCVGLGTTMMFTLGLCTYGGRNLLGPIFSNDPKVWVLVAHLAPLAGFFSLFDGFQACCSSVLRALGRQAQSAAIYGVGFWVFGVPGGALLCFWAGMGVFGLWYGIMIGLIVVCMLSVGVLLLVDWTEEAERTLETIKVPRKAAKKSKLDVV